MDDGTNLGRELLATLAIPGGEDTSKYGYSIARAGSLFPVSVYLQCF